MPLNKSAKQREGPFSGFPTLHRHFIFEITFSPRTLVAAGSQVGDPRPCRSGSCGREQHLLEHRLNHSGSGKGRHAKTRSHKSKGLCWDQEGEFHQDQPERSQRGSAAWTSLPPWSVHLACSLCLHLIACDVLSPITYQAILVRTAVLDFFDRSC